MTRPRCRSVMLLICTSTKYVVVGKALLVCRGFATLIFRQPKSAVVPRFARLLDEHSGADGPFRRSLLPRVEPVWSLRRHVKLDDRAVPLFEVVNFLYFYHRRRHSFGNIN